MSGSSLGGAPESRDTAPASPTTSPCTHPLATSNSTQLQKSPRSHSLLSSLPSKLSPSFLPGNLPPIPQVLVRRHLLQEACNLGSLTQWLFFLWLPANPENLCSGYSLSASLLYIDLLPPTHYSAPAWKEGPRSFLYLGLQHLA